MAGGFTIKSRWKKHHAHLSECVQRAIKKPLNEKSSPSQTALKTGGASGLILTRSRGHAREITGALIAEAALTAEKARTGLFILLLPPGATEQAWRC